MSTSLEAMIRYLKHWWCNVLFLTWSGLYPWAPGPQLYFEKEHGTEIWWPTLQSILNEETIEEVYLQVWDIKFGCHNFISCTCSALRTSLVCLLLTNGHIHWISPLGWKTSVFLQSTRPYGTDTKSNMSAGKMPRSWKGSRPVQNRKMNNASQPIFLFLQYTTHLFMN